MTDPTALAEVLLPCTCPRAIRPVQNHSLTCPAYYAKGVADALRTHAETVARAARRKAFEAAATILKRMTDVEDAVSLANTDAGDTLHATYAARRRDALADAGLAVAFRAAAHPASVEDEWQKIAHLEALLNTPELHDFAKGVVLEAAHQHERWAAPHDVGKDPEDWFWLLGYLGGKALHAAKTGDINKALHHTISSAAALANWHAALLGANNDMRPGIDPPHSRRGRRGRMVDLKIITDFIYPPIPTRNCDWSATLDGYEPGEPYGSR